MLFQTLILSYSSGLSVLDIYGVKVGAFLIPSYLATTESRTTLAPHPQHNMVVTKEKCLHILKLYSMSDSHADFDTSHAIFNMFFSCVFRALHITEKTNDTVVLQQDYWSKMV